MPIFGGVRDDTLNFFLQTAPSVSVLKGHYFFREGDQPLSMFVLEEGGVAVAQTSKGRRHRLSRLRRGDCFGEMALIDLFPRSASVRADKDCSAIEVSSAMLYEVYKCDLEQFALIQMNIARELSRRLRIADERLFRVSVETNSTPTRVDPHIEASNKMPAVIPSPSKISRRSPILWRHHSNDLGVTSAKARPREGGGIADKFTLGRGAPSMFILHKTAGNPSPFV